jgi:hypothetical protein
MMGMDMYGGFVSVKTATKKRAKAVGYFPAIPVPVVVWVGKTERNVIKLVRR